MIEEMTELRNGFYRVLDLLHFKDVAGETDILYQLVKSNQEELTNHLLILTEQNYLDHAKELLILLLHNKVGQTLGRIFLSALSKYKKNYNAALSEDSKNKIYYTAALLEPLIIFFARTAPLHFKNFLKQRTKQASDAGEILINSLPSLKYKFIDILKSTDLLRHLNVIISSYKPEMFKMLDNQDIKFNIAVRKWYYHRQMLYVIAGFNFSDDGHGIFNSDPLCENFYQNLKMLADNIFWLRVNYSEIYQKDALDRLSNPTGWRSPVEISDNLFAHFDNLSKLFKEAADLLDFLKIPVSPFGILEYDKSSEKPLQTIKNLIKKAGSSGNAISADFYKIELEKINLFQLTASTFSQKNAGVNAGKPSIKKNLLKNFYPKLKKKLTEEKIMLLAGLTGNSYSTASSFFMQPRSGEAVFPIGAETELFLLKKSGSVGGLFERNRKYLSSLGGGFFLVHNGFGLVIDPGVNFLECLSHFTGADAVDIDGVACTHPHEDHTEDFKRIVRGVREYNRTGGKKTLYCLFPTADDFNVILPEKLREDFITDVVKNAGIKNFHRQNGVAHLPNTKKGEENGIRVQIFPMVHPIYTDAIHKKLRDSAPASSELKAINKQYKDWGLKLTDQSIRTQSHGFLISPLKNGKPLVNILFTGDGAFSKGSFKEIKPPYLPEIAIVNIAKVNLKEIVIDARERKTSGHLGYQGVLKLLKYFKESLRVIVVSEFFEPQDDSYFRLNLLKTLHEEGKKIPPNNFLLFLPTEPGIHFQFTARDHEIPEKTGIYIGCRSPFHQRTLSDCFTGYHDLQVCRSPVHPGGYPSLLPLCRSCAAAMRNSSEQQP